jgi:hypothetical protein
LFRVTIFVDDRKLSELLHKLPGLAVGQPEVQPVTNAQKKGGKVVAKSGGNSSERFLEHLKANKITTFNLAQAKEAAKAIGASPSSAGYLITQLKKVKLIRHNGKTSQGSAYTVVAK